MADEKFSQFTAGGAPQNNDIFVGLRSGANTKMTYPVPLTVPLGGTGDAAIDAYSVICGGTTTTGAFQFVSGLGTAGQLLTSNGASSLPTWQTLSLAGDTHAIYVAKNGNDSNSGTVNSPLLTIAAALALTTTSSFSNRYVIFAGPGIYNEITLALNVYVPIVGIDPFNTIINITNPLIPGANVVGITSRITLVNLSINGSFNFDISSGFADNTNIILDLHNVYTAGATCTLKGGNTNRTVSCNVYDASFFNFVTQTVDANASLNILSSANIEANNLNIGNTLSGAFSIFKASQARLSIGAIAMSNASGTTASVNLGACVLLETPTFSITDVSGGCTYTYDAISYVVPTPSGSPVIVQTTYTKFRPTLTYYVAPNGVATGIGSQLQPFALPSQAIAAAVAAAVATATAPILIKVASGAYTETTLTLQPNIWIEVDPGTKFTVTTLALSAAFTSADSSFYFGCSNSQINQEDSPSIKRPFYIGVTNAIDFDFDTNTHNIDFVLYNMILICTPGLTVSGVNKTGTSFGPFLSFNNVYLYDDSGSTTPLTLNYGIILNYTGGETGLITIKDDSNVVGTSGTSLYGINVTLQGDSGSGDALTIYSPSARADKSCQANFIGGSNIFNNINYMTNTNGLILVSVDVTSSILSQPIISGTGLEGTNFLFQSAFNVSDGIVVDPTQSSLTWTPVNFTPRAEAIRGTQRTLTDYLAGIDDALSGGAQPWNFPSGNIQMVSNSSYMLGGGVVNPTTALLPIASNQGDIIEIAFWVVTGNTGVVFNIGQGSGQQILTPTGTLTTMGAGHGMTSFTQASASIRLVCSIANTEWIVIGQPNGAWSAY